MIGRARWPFALCFPALFGLLMAISTPAAAQDFHWKAPVTPYMLPGLIDGIVGDVNRDGRADLITTHVSGWGRVAVSLQREDGNFDFPIEYRCNCAPGRPRLLRNGDGWPLIYFEHSVDPNAFPNLSRAGVGFLELRPDMTLVGVRYDNHTLDEMGVVDINQDGKDDLFTTFFTDVSYTTPVFRYVIWYAGDNPLQPKPDVPERLRSWYYLGAPFQYPGVTDSREQYTDITVTATDIDADGYLDHIEGRCPTQCVFRQQPYGHLTMTPTSNDGDLENTAGESAFGDLDGDGLPEQLRAFTGFYGADMLLFMQTAPFVFQKAASYGPLNAPTKPLIRDFDNNGLNDIVVQYEDSNLGGNGWLDTLLQVSPGHFQVVSKRVGNTTMGTTVYADDLDGDGCLDLMLRERIAYSLDRTLRIWHGGGCYPANDFQVQVEGSPEAPDVLVTHVLGGMPSEPRIVRVTLAPALPPTGDIGYAVTPPSACREVPADAPRRTFDCVVPALDAPPGQIHFKFDVAANAGTDVDTQVTAFLLDSAGDIDPGNNRGQLLRRLRINAASSSQ